MSKLTCRELKEHDIVKFSARSSQYGNAEFIFCPIFKRGKLKEMFIWPAQQPDVTEFFRILLPYVPQNFGISAWTHKGMDEPRPWMFFWCREHKCVAFRVYVPKQAKCFRVLFGSWFRIIFDTTDESHEARKE